MEAESAAALEPWIDRWKDLADFEIVPVLTSDEFWRHEQGADMRKPVRQAGPVFAWSWTRRPWITRVLLSPIEPCCVVRLGRGH